MPSVRVTLHPIGASVIARAGHHQGKDKGKKVQLPSVTINVSERKQEHQEIDVTPNVTVSEPPKAAPFNYKEWRKGNYKKGTYT